MLYLHDTNVFIHYLRGGVANETLANQVMSALQFCRLSSVVLFEFESGAAKSGVALHRDRVVRLRQMLPDVAPFDGEAAIYAGRLRAYFATLKPNAQPMSEYEVLIAGHALALGATVVTDNSREFERVPGLNIENWFSR